MDIFSEDFEKNVYLMRMGCPPGISPHRSDKEIDLPLNDIHPIVRSPSHLWVTHTTAATTLSWKQINLKTFDQYILPWHKLRGNVLWKMSWYRILVELTMKQRISRHGFNCFWRCYNSDLEELIWKKNERIA